MTRGLLSITVALLASWSVAAAQNAAPAGAPDKPEPPPPSPPGLAAPAPSTAAPVRPNDIGALNRANTELVLTLLRGTLVALHHANQTGNYTVLRDLGAPDFAVKNSATDLAEIFAPVRAAKIDLAPVVLLDPQISRATLSPDKKLYLTGALATKPLPITFELLFVPVDGVWRCDGLSITPVQNLAAPPPTVLQPTAVPSSPRRRPSPPRPRAAPARPLPIAPKRTDGAADVSPTTP